MDITPEIVAAGGYRNANGDWVSVERDPVTGAMAGGRASQTSFSAPQVNFEDIIKRSIELNKQAVQPAITSLQAQQPEITQKYSQLKTQQQAEVDPLKARYQNLIAQIKGSQQTAENRQTQTTANEMGKRGILPSSGVYQQEMTNVLNPITKEYTGLITDTSLQGEASLRDLQNQIANLTPAELEAQRAVTNAIAQLQSGAAQTGVSQGIGNYQFNINQALQQQQAAAESAKFQEQLKQQQIANELANKEYELSKKQTEYNVNAPYKSGTGDDGDKKIDDEDGQSIADIWFNQQGEIWNNPEVVPVTTLSDGRTLYSDGSMGWTKWSKAQ